MKLELERPEEEIKRLRRCIDKLTSANLELEKEIAGRKRAEKELRRRQAFLEEGQRLSLTSAMRDASERRQSEEATGKIRSELVRVTSLGVLTASIAHEINQPLAGIITNASTCLRMLAADPPNVEGARETARRTIRDGNRASDIVTRLRSLFSKKDPSIEPVDLNDAAQEVIALSLGSLQRDRVILRSKLADNLPTVTGDRVQLQQVILNLLLNAVEAMSGIEGRSRLLMVRTFCDADDKVCLAVQDSGIGIEPQQLHRLFDTFYTTKKGGMGIGLSVSRSIVESHHGRLWASRNEGPGSTFTLAIPRGLEGLTGVEAIANPSTSFQALDTAISGTLTDLRLPLDTRTSL